MPANSSPDNIDSLTSSSSNSPGGTPVIKDVSDS